MVLNPSVLPWLLAPTPVSAFADCPAVAHGVPPPYLTISTSAWHYLMSGFPWIPDGLIHDSSPSTGTRGGGKRGTNNFPLMRDWPDQILHSGITLHAHGLPIHRFLSHQNPPACGGWHTVEHASLRDETLNRLSNGILMDSWPYFLQDGNAQGRIQFNLPWTMEHHAWRCTNAAPSTCEPHITITYITCQICGDVSFF